MRSRSNCLFPLLHFIFLSCNFFFVLTFFTLMLLMNIMVNSEKLGVRILSSTIIQKDTCTPIFIEALFTIAWTWTWKQPKCPSTKEWIKKMCVWRYIYIYTLQFSSSVGHLCPTLCNPMDCSTPGLPVHHQLPEFTQTHVHRVSDAIQPSHPLLSPSPPAFNLSQHQHLFKWVNFFA